MQATPRLRAAQPRFEPRPSKGRARLSSRPFRRHGWAVHVARLRLRDFRNYGSLDAEFQPGFHVVTGDNAQGKTNLLEAVYLLATLRSFRGAGGAQLVRHGARGYFVGATVVGGTTAELAAYWSPRERKLQLNGAPVRRLEDYFGCLRAVVFSPDDTQIVKGPPLGRRRYMDLILAQTTPGYLPLLLRYARALRARNALLKHRAPDEDQLASFGRELVESGSQILQRRRALAPKLSPLARLAFRRIGRDADDLKLEYRPSAEGDFAVALAASRDRERTQRTTVVGPHRDDLSLVVNGHPAGPFTSEGQRRTLALALKIAQAEYLGGIHGSPPVMLVDDVMGELDPHRRAGLLPLLADARRNGGQAFLTCAEDRGFDELGAGVHRWRVQAGRLAPG
jgi:DNA replication and repair protein RecF